MITVTLVDILGHRHEVRANPGTTLMEAATSNDVPGIVGFCGGMCSCGTCHCYVSGEWATRLPPPDDNELDTLRRVLDRRPGSRLGCQIRLSPDYDGLEVEVPARQRTP